VASAKDQGGWKWKAEAEAGLTYDSNIYNLSSAQKQRLEDNTAADQTSGRFDDMESADDFLLTPGFNVTVKTKGPGGGDFELRPGVEYLLYAQNTEKNHLDLSLDLTQELGAKGKSAVSVEIDFSPNVFKKNYLADAVDLSGDGSITRDERVYEKSTYDDLKVDLTYGRRLMKSSKGKKGPSGIAKVDGEVLIGFQNKEYDGPFELRSEDTIRLGAGVDMEFENKVELDVSYLLELIETPVETEVLLRDEDDFGVDFNGDTDTVDQNVRTVQNVDRSRNEHTFAVKASKRLNKDWVGSARYDLRIQNYKSEERFDVTRLDRQDIRHRLGLGAERELMSNLTLGLSWLWVHEEAGRDGLAAIDEAETKSYDRHILAAVLSYKL
jgi:opacity protein-like surface antigen